jgi:HD-like signal output (HDOD) protein
MLSGLLRRLRGRAPVARTVPRSDRRAPTPRHVAPVVDATVSASAPSAVEAIRIDTDEELGAWLERSLRRRCSELRTHAAQGSPDAHSLLDLLEAPSSLVVRQPPLAAQRALAVTRQPESSAAEIVRLVERDPTLTQALLRHANSALYATAGKACVSLADAVRRVGASGVESVVLRGMVEGLLCRPGGAYQAMVDQAWSHMVRTAPLGRALAPLYGMHPDEAFSLALLHDVGKLVIFDQIGVLRGSRRTEPRFPDQFVRSALLLLHEPLGGLAAVEWGVGPVAAGAIATHRRADALTYADAESQLLFVAERAELARLRGSTPDFGAWAFLGRLTADVGKMREAVEGAWSEEPKA